VLAFVLCVNFLLVSQLILAYSSHSLDAHCLLCRRYAGYLVITGTEIVVTQRRGNLCAVDSLFSLTVETPLLSL
jgi:hypothetical protein